MTGNRSQLMNFVSKFLGKSKKSSHQPKAEDTNQEKLYLLHIDLCGPMRVASINGKSLGLVPNPVSQQPCIPPNKDDWDHLFQPMFDEYFNPPTIFVSPVLVAAASRAIDLADSHVSTSIDQDAPSTIPYLDKVFLIKLKWIYKVKTDEFGRVLKNKAGLVDQGFRQEEDINFDESFALVTRIEAILFMEYLLMEHLGQLTLTHENRLNQQLLMHQQQEPEIQK
nr:retrovirus-related Pol polyprotein from transposon TNT 1-94 [Tanacetum cinerariifolium]